MNNAIKKLNKKLQDAASDAAAIEIELQAEWNKIFDDSGKIKAMVAKVESSTEYTTDQYGEISSFARVDLSDFEDCKLYFQEYMRDTHFISVDLENDAVLLNQGDDNLIIQDDTRRDNGVWQGQKLVISEDEYKNEDGEVDEAKRNALIEAHMEKTGYFPGVFRVDYHGNISAVNTKE